MLQLNQAQALEHANRSEKKNHSNYEVGTASKSLTKISRSR
jgi:hypothetical protein